MDDHQYTYPHKIENKIIDQVLFFTTKDSPFKCFHKAILTTTTSQDLSKHHQQIGIYKHGCGFAHI